MASITNQWLKGSVERERTHSPETVVLRLAIEPNALRRQAGLVFRLIFERADGDYQIVTLTPQEIRALLEFALANADGAMTAQLHTTVERLPP